MYSTINDKEMVSAVIITKNEEKNIVECLKSLAFCDEIIVIDDLSTDNTLTLGKKHKAKVFSRSLDGDFSAQRNFGLEKASGDWVLFVDADERVSDALAAEISNFIRPVGGSNFQGFYVRRIDFMWGRELRHGETGNIKLLRLARKNEGRWDGKVHEVWNINGNVGELENPLDHYPHQTIEEFLTEINFYTDLRAGELYEERIASNWFFIILYPKAKFFVNYFLKRGFLDGLPGLIFVLLMSFHSFLVRGKLWLLWQRK